MLSTLSREEIQYPARFANVKYSDVPASVRKQFERAMKEKKGLYLWGDCGVGKTHIVHGFFRKFVEKKIGAKLYNSPELLDVIRDYYGKSGYYEYRDNKLKLLLDYEGVLIIDDLGAEKPTQWVAETFYKIINVRYEKMLRTIFTSNLSLEQLADAVGDRIPSRIAEMCEVIHLGGEDRRLK